jgi:hypothetical protein
MRRPRKALCFQSDLYHQDFLYLHKWPLKAVEEIMGPLGENCGGAADMKDGIIYIWVNPAFKSGIAGRLSHEAVHAANFVLGSRGVVVSAKDDEAQAYLVQWIFDHCYKLVKKLELKK